MRYLPIWLDVKNKPCLMVGGGEVASRKSEMLIKAGARLTVISPKLGVNMQTAVDAGTVQHIHRTFEPDDVLGMRLVVAATEIKNVNQHVYACANAHNILVNVVDTPEQCDFVNGAVVERDDITIAISSGGGAPVLARALKAKLETIIPSAYGKLAGLASKYRDTVKATLHSSARRGFWERVFDGPIAEASLAGQNELAERLLMERIASEQGGEPEGEVYLIGAGPGDPDLLTFKALRLLQKADVVVYDRLVSEPILNLARREAERVYVGKKTNDHVMAQEDISQTLVRLAKAGNIVARLKGGDPFMFGRGGEEIELLAEHRIPFQVVPAVTAATGCSAYSGIPLTHRDYAQSCVFVTGHAKNDSLAHLDWQNLTASNQTAVFYMGLGNVGKICQHLIQAGAPNTRPACIVEQGTTTEQRVIIGNLSNLAEKANAQKARSPSLIIVGDVVNLNEKLGWYEAKLDQSIENSHFPRGHMNSK